MIHCFIPGIQGICNLDSFFFSLFLGYISDIVIRFLFEDISDMVKDESADTCMELSKRKMSTRNKGDISFNGFPSFINSLIIVNTLRQRPQGV
jgi:hypothetical protein